MSYNWYKEHLGYLQPALKSSVNITLPLSLHESNQRESLWFHVNVNTNEPVAGSNDVGDIVFPDAIVPLLDEIIFNDDASIPVPVSITLPEIMIPALSVFWLILSFHHHYC